MIHNYNFDSSNNDTNDHTDKHLPSANPDLPGPSFLPPCHGVNIQPWLQGQVNLPRGQAACRDPGFLSMCAFGPIVLWGMSQTPEEVNYDKP